MFPQLHTALHGHFATLEQWFASIITLPLALMALTSARRVLWRRMGRWARSTATKWDELFLAQLDLPVRLLVIMAAFACAIQVAPRALRAHPAIFYAEKFALIGLAVWALDRLASAFLQSDALPRVLKGSTRALLLTLVRVLFLGLGFLIVLDTLGISITPILASLGVGSVAVALALQETLSNFFSGIYILVDEPIRPDDFIQIDDQVQGYVAKIGWRSTHIRMLANNTVVIPNSKLASARITNYDLPERECGLVIPVGVSYDCDLDKVEKITIEVAAEVLKRVAGAVAGFEPFIRYNKFDASSINFSVILRMRTVVDQYLITHEFIKALHKRYRAEGVEIPFPQQVVHMRAPQASET